MARVTNVAKMDSVGYKYPELAEDWHDENNRPVTAYSLLPGSSKSVDWKCSKCGYVWKTRVIHRAKGTNCPNCYQHVRHKVSFAETHPEIAAQWNNELNYPYAPEDYTAGSAVMAWFTCEKGHDSKTSIYHKANGRGCPYCTNQKAGYGNTLGDNCPEVSSWWHPTKNGDLTPFDVTVKSNKKVWWLRNGRESFGKVADRTKKVLK